MRESTQKCLNANKRLFDSTLNAKVHESTQKCVNANKRLFESTIMVNPGSKFRGGGVKASPSTVFCCQKHKNIAQKCNVTLYKTPSLPLESFGDTVTNPAP